MSASFHSYLPSEVSDVGYAQLFRIRGYMLQHLQDLYDGWWGADDPKDKIITDLGERWRTSLTTAYHEVRDGEDSIFTKQDELIGEIIDSLHELWENDGFDYSFADYIYGT